MTQLNTIKSDSETMILFLTLLRESSRDEFEEVGAIIFLRLSQTNREMVAWQRPPITNWFRNF